VELDHEVVEALRSKSRGSLTWIIAGELLPSVIKASPLEPSLVRVSITFAKQGNC
jgi:hypothetical protein